MIDSFIAGFYPGYYDHELNPHNQHLSYFGYRPAAYVAIEHPGFGGYDGNEKNKRQI